MAISDDIQRHMPSAADRDAPRAAPLAYKEAVLLVHPIEPQFKGEVVNTTRTSKLKFQTETESHEPATL